MSQMTNGTSHQHKAIEITDKFVNVAGTPTHLIQIGNLDQAGTIDHKYLFLVVPGNPGVPTFYEDFMIELYKNSGYRIPVWAISHAGHSQAPSESLELHDIYATDEKKYGLQAQIEHKVNFIKKYVPPDVKLILVGHSIGCYFILNVLDKLAPDTVHRCFFLFPTIERMAVSPNGVNHTPLLRYFRWIIVFVALLLCLILPSRIREMIISFIYRKTDHPECMEIAILKTVTPWTVNFTTFLAKTEMCSVTELQKDLIDKHLDKLSLYYGSCDLWCPQQYFIEIKEHFPTIDARMCKNDMKHAFVMLRKEGQQMANILWEWLEKQSLPSLLLKKN